MAESTALHREKTSGWNRAEVVDSARLKVEKEALDELFADLERAWQKIVERYATNRSTAGRGSSM